MVFSASELENKYSHNAGSYFRNHSNGMESQRRSRGAVQVPWEREALSESVVGFYSACSWWALDTKPSLRWSKQIIEQERGMEALEKQQKPWMLWLHPLALRRFGRMANSRDSIQRNHILPELLVSISIERSKLKITNLFTLPNSLSSHGSCKSFTSFRETNPHIASF